MMMVTNSGFLAIMSMPTCLMIASKAY
jgi:hypothetical protein